jgi:hypothetical protein
MNFYSGIKYGCYRNSCIFSAGIASVVLFHKLLGTWQKSVDLYIALSEFALQQYKKLGFPSESFFVKPNFLQNTVVPNTTDNRYGIYIDASERKKVWTACSRPSGVVRRSTSRSSAMGPWREHLIKRLRSGTLRKWNILACGHHDQMHEIAKEARFHVLPSLCYEGIPMVLLEAMSAENPYRF